MNNKEYSMRKTAKFKKKTTIPFKRLQLICKVRKFSLSLIVLLPITFFYPISFAQSIIINHNCIDVTKVPEYWIEKAKSNLRIAYGHTSHGSQIVTGMGVLADQYELYSYNHDGTNGALSIYDRTPSGDLGNLDRITWAQRTRDLLDSQGNDRNVIMWSWCGQADTSEENIDLYLSLMDKLEVDYPEILFIYMTGHLNGTGEEGNLHLRNNQIRDFCRQNNKTLFDFADIESYDPDGNYFLDKYADDECYYDSDGNGSRDANWAVEWCNANPGGCSSCTCAHSKSLNCDMKGSAFWWMMARLAGWKGENKQSDLLGTWAGQGIYYRNSDTGAWVKMATSATQITAGDIDGDGTDDLLGIWPSQGGVWVKYSSDGSWACLSSTADWIGAGDMNGDGKDDLLGTWMGQGVYYRDSQSGSWVKQGTSATKIIAGDIDGDGTDDLADWISAGDMNGDGKDDLLGTWTGQGVYYRDSQSGSWVKMATSATQITVGDIGGDGTDDLLGIWPSQGGVWVKYSSNGSWGCLSSTADWIATGKMRSGSGSSSTAISLSYPIGGYADGPANLVEYVDLSSEGPGGWNFVFQAEKNLFPQEKESMNIIRLPGPGEPGFRYVEQENLLPQENVIKTKQKNI